ncbi:MAG: hypothetical protein ACM3NH_03485 [Candidatus Saccharibacteria bacterium]
MFLRILFAWIGVTLFVLALTGQFWLTLIVMFVVFGSVSAIVFIGGELAAARVGRFLGLFMRTNNRWLFWMFLITLTAFIWNFKTAKPGPPPVTQSYQEAYSKNQVLKDIEENRQRRLHLFREGKYQTDQELGQTAPKPETANDWSDWSTRWLASWILLILTILYVPFAFRDEIAEAFQELRSRWTERQEVTSDNPFRLLLQRLVARREPGATVPGAPALSGWRSFLNIIKIDLLIETAIAIFKHWRRGRA